MKPEDITAWALNEVSPEERARIEAEFAATPQAQQKARETQAFCALLSEHLVDEDAAFRPEQRERLQALELPAPENVVPFATAAETPRMNGKAFHAKVAAAREQATPKPSPWMRLAALAACLMFALFVIHQSRNLTPAVAVAQTAANGPPEKAVIVVAGKSQHSPRSTTMPAPPMPPAAPMLAMQKDAPLELDSPTSDPFAKAGAAPTSLDAPAPTAPTAMTQTGAATLTLNGFNTYGGGATIVNGGTLAIGGSPAAAAAPAPRLEDKADAQPSPEASLTAMTKAGAGTLFLGGANSYTGGITFGNGTLSTANPAGQALPALPFAGSTTMTGSGGIALNGGGLLQFTPGDAGLKSGVPTTGTAIGSNGVTFDGTALTRTTGSTVSLGTAGSTSRPGWVSTSLDYSLDDSDALGINGGGLDLNGFFKAIEPTPLSAGAAGSGTLTLGAGILTASDGVARNVPGSTTTSGTTATMGTLSGNIAETDADPRKSEGLKPSAGSTAIYKSIKDMDSISAGGTASTAVPAQTAKAKAATAAPSSRYDLAANGHARAQMLAQVDEAWENEVPITPLRRQRQDYFATKAAPAPVPGTERYAHVIENAFQTVQSQPLSTFSIDVDTASYANVRRFLNAGHLPPPDAVRLEELINYFPYDYEKPGKDQPFSVQVDLAEAPWAPQHRLARVAIKGRDVGQERPAANFVFLVDVSGSMDSPERLPLVKQCLQLLTEQLRDDDHVSIVTYAGDCRVALESTSGKEKDWIVEIINNLHAGGSTNGESGITMAYNQAGAHFVKGGINRIILCTDGDFNVGISDADQLQQLIKQKAKGGTFLSVLGCGTDNLQDRTMQVLADNGNGNYAYIDSLAEARKVLVEQMRGTLITIAKDVKIQVEFNPALVASYRLIGYEKRPLAAKDFNNDKKDAGEIGAGHTITALYELVPAGLPLPNGALGEVDDLKYQPKDKDKNQPLPALGARPPEHLLEGINDETMTVKLRYKAPDGKLSKLIEVPVRDAKKTLQDSPRDFRFATAVAGFGMLLRDSEHVEDFSFETVRKLALSGKGEDALGYRGEFIQLIDKAKGLKATKR